MVLLLLFPVPDATLVFLCVRFGFLFLLPFVRVSLLLRNIVYASCLIPVYCDIKLNSFLKKMAVIYFYNFYLIRSDCALLILMLLIYFYFKPFLMYGPPLPALQH